MREYFDHYLKGAPAPDWMVEGVPRLKMEEHLKKRNKKAEPPKKITTGTLGFGLWASGFRLWAWAFRPLELRSAEPNRPRAQSLEPSC
jgi:hypothetical protein